MRNCVLVTMLGLILAVPASGLDRTRPVMEARVYFDNTHHLEQLGDLAGELDVCTWQEDETGGWLLIDTDAEQLARIQALGFATEVTWADIRDKFRAVTGCDPNVDGAFRNFNYYFTYWEMSDTLDRLVANFPNLCQKFSAGTSFQGRALWGLKISDDPSQPEGEPACFFNGATHAREPLGTHCCIAFAARILSQYGVDSVATWLINNREIYIVPVMNPDGYVYNSDSGGSSSNWRKNRRGPVPPNIGIDLNRNYGYKWGYDNSGSSGQPSSETYRGPSRFSEPETQVARDFMALHSFRTCMDFHTFGQYNMYAWGYAGTQPPERALLQEMVDTFRVNNNYPSGNTGQVYSTIYPCNGISTDWAYSDTTGKFVTYGFDCELGTNDFWYGSNDTNYIRNECNGNVPNLYYLTRLSGVWFEKVSVTVNDSVGGNGDGILNPGENATIWFTVKNRAVHPIDSAWNVTARLRSGYPEVTVLDSVKPFPNVARRTQANNRASQIAIHASGDAVPNTRVPLRLELSYTDDSRAYMQPVNFEITIGSSTAVSDVPAGVAIEAVQVLPTLARNHVAFIVPRTGIPGHIDVVSADGACLKSCGIDGAFTWDCRGVPAGIYFARITMKGATAVRRFSIAR